MIICGLNVRAQIHSSKPKLVVGIVVDQMRYDLLTRFQMNYSEGGFKRLMARGFTAENMQYNYAPTITGPGHSSIYTGTTPAIHGIAANNWYEDNRNVYCSEDTSVSAVSGTQKAGQMSPRNLLTTTVTDQLKLFTSGKSRIYGVALKDRGAILPAGHLADGVFWYDGKSGNWMTSSFYKNAFPSYITTYNKSYRIYDYMSQGWKLMKPLNKYFSNDLTNDYEEDAFKIKSTTFPYIFKATDYNEDIKTTPYGNSMTTDISLEILKNEKLGLGITTDFLAISYSSTDYIGHSFGPYSMETEDCYYRLDAEIAKLLDALDIQLGKDNYWLFLTADHGIQDIPAMSTQMSISAGSFKNEDLTKKINHSLALKFPDQKIVAKVANDQIYLTEENIERSEEIASYLRNTLTNYHEGIAGFFSFEHLASSSIPFEIREKLIKGYKRGRSGHISILLEPGWMTGHGPKGTTHASPYSHDSHVPFLFYGKGTQKKSSSQPYQITDIAPTLSYLLGILYPNGCIGKPIPELDYLK